MKWNKKSTWIHRFFGLQQPLLDTEQKKLESIRFVVPKDWKEQISSEGVHYYLSPNESGSITVLCSEKTEQAMLITDEATICADPFVILQAYVDGMKQELEAYQLFVLGQEMEWTEDFIPVYGLSYTIEMDDNIIHVASVLLLMKHQIYCISFSDRTGSVLFPYIEDFFAHVTFVEGQ